MRGMDLKTSWYDAIGARVSRRRFAPQAVPAELRARLEAHIAETGALRGARACLVDDAGETLFTGVLGGYGAVSGMPLTAAFIGRDGGADEGADADSGQSDVGYLGEAFILEATGLGLGTCWIAGSFDKERAGRVIELAPGERVVAITPLGYPTKKQPGGERLLRSAVRASARISVEKLAPGILDGTWPRWAVTAVQAARLAPSGANRQPWRFRLSGDALVMSRAAKLYWTAPIDLGIARLHLELGAAHEGVSGAWEELPAPDVARFTPSA